jgi:Raf kinase inhibitor-like YbhB/YbcL family protein
MKNILLTVSAFALCGFTVARADTGRIFITSPDFQQEALMPAADTCDGSNTHPALSWEGVPTGTKTLALIADDPDSPKGTWTHWVVYDIPINTNTLRGTLPDSIRQGKNSFGATGYGGPCPPPGDKAHRYYFRMYALNTTLDLSPDSTGSAALKQAMKGHILAQGELMGRYQR